MHGRPAHPASLVGHQVGPICCDSLRLFRSPRACSVLRVGALGQLAPCYIDRPAYIGILPTSFLAVSSVCDLRFRFGGSCCFASVHRRIGSDGWVFLPGVVVLEAWLAAGYFSFWMVRVDAGASCG